MKKLQGALLILLVLALQACKSDEQILVEQVVAPYSGSVTCTISDLVGQNAPQTTTDSSLVYVTKAKEYDDGYIRVLDQVAYLKSNREFVISTSDYYLSGEFDDNGGLSMSEDKIDHDLQQRFQCTYTLQRQ
jgi:hypothetical protein